MRVNHTMTSKVKKKKKITVHCINEPGGRGTAGGGEYTCDGGMEGGER